MARVVMHKASDGSLHETQEKFAKHETRLKAEAGVRELVEKSFAVSEEIESEIICFILNNADALQKVLADAKVPVQGRRKGSAKTAQPAA